MDIKRNFLFILFFTLMLATKGYSQETIIPELSSNYVQKLIDTAKANYPKVKSFQNHINIAKSTITKNKIGYLEALTVSYIYQPNNQTTINPANPTYSYFNGFQAGVFLNIGSILERPYIVNQSKQELLIAQNDQDDYMLSLVAEIKKRYYIYTMRLAELKIQSNGVQTSEATLKDAKYRFEKGEETFENYNKIQTDFTNRQESKIQAEANLFIAKADLEEMLGTKLENIK